LRESNTGIFSHGIEISPPNWSTPELPSEFKPKLQQREVLAPEEKVVLPNYGLPVKSQSLGIATKIVHGVQHGLQHIFDSSSADHGSCYLEFRKKKKTPTDYFSAFRVALGFLQVLRQHQKIGASVDFSEFSMSLEKRSVSIAITGRNNAGKTTLINAMVGNRILPVHRRPETAVRVYLRHRETCAVTGPELTESFGNEMCQTVACGREYVLQYIRGRNEEVRSYQTKRDRQQQIMKDEKLILHLNMPLLCSKSRVQIVDTPGFAALDQPHLDDAAGRVLRGSAAYILLISYHQLSNSGDLSILDQLKLLDRAVSSDRRLIIAVTQHDISYTQSSDAEMSPSETIQFVSEIFKGLCHHDITEDQIIPVSGKWALTARMLKKDPSNDTYLKEARRALTDYREFQACGQDHRSSSLSDVQQMDAKAIADALEEASNIAALEFRYT
jgi:GTPase SAR1 family protein